MLARACRCASRNSRRAGARLPTVSIGIHCPAVSLIVALMVRAFDGLVALVEVKVVLGVVMEPISVLLAVFLLYFT